MMFTHSELLTISSILHSYYAELNIESNELIEKDEVSKGDIMAMYATAKTMGAIEIINGKIDDILLPSYAQD